MIKVFKNFTKKKFAGLLLILVIIVAFGLGGFGGGFNIGNQNNIAKINNVNITTQDFIDYLNQSGLSQEVIKENIEKNVLEELLTTLVSTKLLELEIEDLNLKISENILIEKIKKNKNFQDENGKFQRTIYEKFLLTNNLLASTYELRLKSNILQKQLFDYIGGGTRSSDFLINKFYKENNKKLTIDYIKLEKFYKNENEFTKQELENYISENYEELKQDYIDFSYVIINPKNLTGLNEYDQTFFEKVDEIENKISKNIDFNTIVEGLNIKTIVIKNYINLDNKNTIKNKIYNSRKNEIEIFDDEENFIFYQIDKTSAKVSDLDNNDFQKKIRKLLYQESKFNFNKKILDQINEKKFNQASFNKLGTNNSKKILFNSINDDTKFDINSIKFLYALPINSFTLISDNDGNIYVAKIVDFEEKDISKDSDEFIKISTETNTQTKNSILKSYDLLLNSKYKVVINEKTLDRVKNYFK